MSDFLSGFVEQNPTSIPSDNSGGINWGNIISGTLNGFGIPGLTGTLLPPTSSNSGNDMMSRLLQLALAGTIGALNNQPTTTDTAGTTNTSGTGTTTSSNNRTGTTTRKLTPYQTAIQPQIFNLISRAMTNPGSILDPLQTGAREDVNKNFASVGQQLREQFLSNGNQGASGKFGSANLQADLARRGALSGVDTEFAKERATLPLSLLPLAQQFLGMNFGEDTTDTGSGTSTTNQTGTNTFAGTQRRQTGNSLTSGLNTALALLFRNLNGGGGTPGTGLPGSGLPGATPSTFPGNSLFGGSPDFAILLNSLFGSGKPPGMGGSNDLFSLGPGGSTPTNYTGSLGDVTSGFLPSDGGGGSDFSSGRERANQLFMN